MDYGESTMEIQESSGERECVCVFGEVGGRGRGWEKSWKRGIKEGN